MLEWFFKDAWVLVVFFAVVFYFGKKFLVAKPEVKDAATDAFAKKSIDLIRKFIK